MVLGVGLFTLLWSLASEFVAAFQCSMPRPWQVTDNRCLDRVWAMLASDVTCDLLTGIRRPFGMPMVFLT